MEKVKVDDNNLLEKSIIDFQIKDNNLKNNEDNLDDEQKSSNNCTQNSLRKHSLFSNEMENLISKSYSYIGENVS